MKRLLLLLLVLLLPFIRCKKTPTLSGDYIVCYVNGKEWVAGCSSLMFSNCLNAEWSNQKKDFLLSGINDASQEIGITLIDTISNTELKSGTFLLNNHLIYNCANYQDCNISYSYYFNTDSVYVGSITIIFDTINSRVSGSFSFRAVLDYTMDTVDIKGGRFSLPYHID